MNYTSVFTGQADDQAVYVDLTYCARGLYQLAIQRRGTYYMVGERTYTAHELCNIQLGAIDALRLADPTQRVEEASA